jgi:hypothetical protein
MPTVGMLMPVKDAKATKLAGREVDLRQFNGACLPSDGTPRRVRSSTAGKLDAFTYIGLIGIPQFVPQCYRRLGRVDNRINE